MRQDGKSHKILFVLLLVFACGTASLYWTGIGSGAATAADSLLPQTIMIVNVKSHEGVSRIETLKVTPTFHFPVKKSAPLPAVSKSGKPRLVIQDKDGNSLYEMEFSYPRVMTIPPPASDIADGIPAVLPIDSPEVSLVVPSFSDASKILVFDGGNETASSSKPAGDAQTVPNFVLEASEVGTPARHDEFNILIIASGYTSSNMTNFQTRAAGIKSILAGTEPFSSYPYQVKINIYTNTADLGCYTGCDEIERLMCCDSNEVISAAASSGYPFDEIIVVDNTSTYAGCGYRGVNYKTNSYSDYAAVYDGPYSEVMALHEFGHSFGDLCDEYLDSSEEQYPYSNCVNCRANCSSWSAYSTACQLGCDVMPSYYRPDNSVMYSLSYNTYNQASIEATYSPDGLLKRLQYFAGPVGSLSVTITPAAAVSAGAMWGVDDGSWQASGATVANLSVGSHTVGFKGVQGWTAPSSLKVKILNGKTTSAIGTYISPPVGGFTALSTSGKVPLKIHFIDSSAGSIKKWLWNFGDGTTSQIRNPIHTYSKAGTYSVTLTVTGAGGTNTCTKPGYIEAYAAPKANFSARLHQEKLPFR